MTTRYKDLAGEVYETGWNLKPTIFRDGRYVQGKGVEDVARGVEALVGMVEALSQDLKAGRPGARDIRDSNDRRRGR